LTPADAVDDGFTGLATTLLSYVGEGVVLVVAVAGVAMGVRFLIKYARLAFRAS
jgi:hypothetical protein